MTHTVGCVVAGGGIAGLMSAARLAAAGWRVVLLERGLLGSGATTSNHGMIHSGGALYARWHPQIVTACRQAIGGRTAETFRAENSAAAILSPFAAPVLAPHIRLHVSGTR